MTIFEIADLFPNGLHDAEVESVHIADVARTVSMTAYVWVGSVEDPGDDREPYRRGTLEFHGLRYCGMDVPAEHHTGAAFTCRFWVNEWNGFLHLAAQEARFTWTDLKPDESSEP